MAMDSDVHVPERKRRVNRIPDLLVGGLAAFGVYFAMYAFRRPFAAATYANHADWPFALDYKTALLIAQVLGYALSKFIGVAVIAGFGRTGRAMAIFGLIALSWLALVLFALIPAPWNVVCLFFNGLPLGMIWGLVFSYIEGRRASELLGAILCASFVVSTGMVKSVAVALLASGVSEAWMPAATGLLFVPLLLACLVLLERMPPPDARDEQERAPRVAMTVADRTSLLAAYAAPLGLLVAGYVLLTAIRDFRDNFAVELWADFGVHGVSSVFSVSELLAAVIVLGSLAALMLVRDNLRAVLAMHGAVVAGAAILGLATLAFQTGRLGPLAWMSLSGVGLYLAYTPFNAMLFDRIVAATGRPGNAGFLIYIADSAGYVGSIALLLYRSLLAPDTHWLTFYMMCVYATVVALILFTLASGMSFVVLLRKTAQPAR